MTDTSASPVPVPAGNPFTPGRVVPPERFVGRQIELGELQGRLSGMLSVTLVGEARIGKSSLLAFLEARLPAMLAAQGRYVPVLLSMDAQRSKAAFCRAVLAGLLPHTPPGDAPELELRALEQAPIPGEADLRRAVELARAAGLRPVLLLDEFKHLADHPDEFDDFFLGGLRSLYTHGQVALVLATRQPLIEIPRLNHYFANGTTTLTLQRLMAHEAEALIRQPSDRPFGDAETSLCLSAGDRHPLRLQIAGYTLYQAKARADTRYYDDAGNLTPQASACLRRAVAEEFENAQLLSQPRQRKQNRFVMWITALGRAGSDLGKASEGAKEFMGGVTIAAFIVVILVLVGACGLRLISLEDLAKFLGRLIGGS